MTISPRTMAMRYRIYCYANPKGWDVTIADIAEALDESRAGIRRVLTDAGWTDRIRATRQDTAMSSWNGSARAAANHIAAGILSGLGRIEA
jgi:hypothetical protein